MRLSWTVIITQSLILVLLGLSIGLEAFALVNDLRWNAILDNKNPKDKLTATDFRNCRLYHHNGSLFIPDDNMYNAIFTAKKRDLPFELPFLILISFSFTMYLVVSTIYIAWKKVLPNIYICISTNVLGTLIHTSATGLILASTLLYTRKYLHYMGHELCYGFDCPQCQDHKNYRERAQSMHEESKECLESLNICQSTGLKDRTVYLVFGCVICSCVALGSSVRRLTRYHRKASRVQPKQPSALLAKSTESNSSYSVPLPSMENLKWNPNNGGPTTSRIQQFSTDTL